jgi:hypothetical protein
MRELESFERTTISPSIRAGVNPARAFVAEDYREALLALGEGAAGPAGGGSAEGVVKSAQLG